VRTFGLVLLVLAGAFAVGILVFNFVLMPRLVQHDVTVQVPQVVGLGSTKPGASVRKPDCSASKRIDATATICRRITS
jgi:hypothetical protein